MLRGGTRSTADQHMGGVWGYRDTLILYTGTLLAMTQRAQREHQNHGTKERTVRVAMRERTTGLTGLHHRGELLVHVLM